MVNDRESGDDVDFVWWGERVNGVEIRRVFEDFGRDLGGKLRGIQGVDWYLIGLLFVMVAFERAGLDLSRWSQLSSVERKKL